MTNSLSFDLRFFSKSQLKEIIDKCDFPKGWISLSVIDNCFRWECRDENRYGIVFAFGKSEREAINQYKLFIQTSI
jgi:hypothetical protein